MERYQTIFLSVLFLQNVATSIMEHNCPAAEKKIYVVHINEEQMREKMTEARQDCWRRIINTKPPDTGTYCTMTFGGGVCWPYSPAGTEVSMPCPDYVHLFYTKGKVRRTCNADGHWAIHPVTNKTLTNFSECLSYKSNEKSKVPVDDVIREHAYSIKLIQEVGSYVSLVLLVAAVMVMTVFRKLHCQRNVIHINLFLSFILRATMSMVKDVYLVPPGSAKVDGEEIRFNQTGKAWPCKLVNTLFHYITTANYMWIFVEGIYLHTLIFFAMSKTTRMFKFCLIFGWVAPLPSTLSWMLVRMYLADSLCWSTIQFLWIVRGPIVAVIAINFLLFLNIIRVLYTKLTAPNIPDPRRHRKLASSTLVLIPLFGVFYILFIAIPDCVNTSLFLVLMYLEIIWSSFQGTLVAFLFCFLNSEVRGEVKKLRLRLRPHHSGHSTFTKTMATGASVSCWERPFPESTRDTEIYNIQSPDKLSPEFEENLLLNQSDQDSPTHRTGLLCDSQNL